MSALSLGDAVCAEIGPSVNIDARNELYYDFYGFPDHYYKVTFESAGSPEMLEDVTSALESSGTSVERVKRSVDHGVFGASRLSEHVIADD